MSPQDINLSLGYLAFNTISLLVKLIFSKRNLTGMKH